MDLIRNKSNNKMIFNDVHYNNKITSKNYVFFFFMKKHAKYSLLQKSGDQLL